MSNPYTYFQKPTRCLIPNSGSHNVSTTLVWDGAMTPPSGFRKWSRVKDRIEHRLVQKHVPHPLGNDHIHCGVFGRELNRFHSAPHNPARYQIPPFGDSGDACVRDHIGIPIALTMSPTLSAILLASTANTRFAPARAANPTPSTTAPRKTLGLEEQRPRR